MIDAHARRGLVAGGLLALAMSLTACQSLVACDAAVPADGVFVTIDGDDSQVDRVFVCAATVKECVVPRQPGDPVTSRRPGPWWAMMNPVGERPTVADVYVVDVNDTILTKQRVSLVWATDRANERCGGAVEAAVTVSLTDTKWERG